MKKPSNKFSFGVICPPFTGHLNPMLSLGLEAIQRGHKVTLFHYNISGDLSKVNQLGIETVSISTEPEAKLLLNELKVLGKLTGWSANEQTGRIYEKLAEINFNSLPKKLEVFKCNALLIDQSFFEGESIASITQLPFINICNALMLNSDITLPPMFMAWQLNYSIIGLLRNLLGYLYIGLKSTNPSKLINQYREKENLPSYPSILNKDYFTHLWSKVATITQQPAAFEFPRSTLGNNFHFTGPFINPALRENITFPWERLNGKPLIYASIGTLQNSLDNIYEKIAHACVGLDCQLVISLGRKNCSQKSINGLPQDVIVTSYAPQLELLKKAKLCITHAGINTTLESLSNGVPMIAIPIANDQPGVAARIVWTKTGKILKHNCKVSQLNKAIKEVLQDDSYCQNALKMQQEIKKIDAIKRAVDIIEEALLSYWTLDKQQNDSR